MHELSLVQSLFDELEIILNNNNLSRITDFYLQVGEVSGVDIEIFNSTYELFISETKWSSVKLHRIFISWTVQCPKCNKIQRVENLNKKCLSCGEESTLTISGDEFIIQKVEGEID